MCLSKSQKDAKTQADAPPAGGEDIKSIIDKIIAAIEDLPNRIKECLSELTGKGGSNPPANTSAVRSSGSVAAAAAPQATGPIPVPTTPSPFKSSSV